MFAQTNEIPVLESGLKTEFRIDKKGKKTLTLEVLDVAYQDSTARSCFSKWKIRATVKGTDLNAWYNGNILLKDSEPYVIESSYWVKLNERYDITFSYTTNGLFAEERIITFAYIPPYDPSDYFAAQERAAKRRQEEEARLARERARADSISLAHQEMQNKLLTLECLANNVGASFFTKEKIEADYEVSPITYNGGHVFYDFPKCPVTMEFDDKTHVCTEISFRLYGEDGYWMKSDLINYGYQLKSKSRDNLIIENNFWNVQTGPISIYKCRLKNGGYSTCRITEGQAMMFTFTRTKN